MNRLEATAALDPVGMEYATVGEVVIAGRHVQGIDGEISA